MSGNEMHYIQEAFDTNWVVPLGPNVNAFEADLEEYDQSIINFYVVYEAACKRGVADGSIRDDVDFHLLYVTYGHAMMELAKKLLRGEILPTDNFSEGSKELEMLVKTAVEYVRKR